MLLEQLKPLDDTIGFFHAARARQLHPRSGTMGIDNVHWIRPFMQDL